MPRKKTPDPQLVKLLEAQDKATAACRRWWRRVKAAVHRLDAAERAVRRLAKRVAKREQELADPKAKEQ